MSDFGGILGLLNRLLRVALFVSVIPTLSWAGLTWDLANTTVTQTNRGIVINLFPSPYDATVADPYTLTVTVNGQPKVFTNRQLTPGVYLDDQDIFYNNTYVYSIRVDYASTNYTTSKTVSTVTNAVMVTNLAFISNSGGPDFRSIGTLDMQVLFPSNALASNTWFTLAFATNITAGTYRFTGSAFMEYQLSDGNTNQILFLPRPLTVQFHLQLTNSSFISLPGFYGAAINLTNKEDFCVGLWDGRTWIPRITTYSLSSSRVTLSALISEEGRYGIIYRAWSQGNANVETGQLSSRLMCISSSDPVYRNFHATFPNPSGETVIFVAYDVYGRVVFENRATQGTSVLWDGTTRDGRTIPPGIYVYVIKVGTVDTRTYRGSFMVMAQ